jgi:hypothetical protein
VEWLLLGEAVVVVDLVDLEIHRLGEEMIRGVEVV